MAAHCRKGFGCRERRYRAGRRQSRRQTVPTCRLGAPSFVKCPRHAHFDDTLLAKQQQTPRQTTPRRNESLARAETGSSAKTKTTARTSERKARPVWILGRKEKCLRWLLIHGTTRAQLHAKQAKPQRLGESSSPGRTGTYNDGSFSQTDNGSESPHRPGVPVHTTTAASLRQTRLTTVHGSFSCAFFT